jgi:hypothetical protein
MDGNSVTLNLNDYNELRDFRTKMEKKHTLKIYSNGGWSSTNYISTEDAVKEIAAANVELKKNYDENSKRFNEIYEENKKLESENLGLKAMLPDSMKPKAEVTLNDLKRMSIWEFMKWRKK